MLNVNIEGLRLQALQELSICRYRLHFGQNVTGMLQLQHLRRVSFADSTVNGPGDESQYAAAKFHFGRLRLHAQVNGV